jgi:hypothetical protein
MSGSRTLVSGEKQARRSIETEAKKMAHHIMPTKSRREKSVAAN